MNRAWPWGLLRLGRARSIAAPAVLPCSNRNRDRLPSGGRFRCSVESLLTRRPVRWRLERGSDMPRRRTLDSPRAAELPEQAMGART